MVKRFRSHRIQMKPVYPIEVASDPGLCWGGYYFTFSHVAKTGEFLVNRLFDFACFIIFLSTSKELGQDTMVNLLREAGASDVPSLSNRSGSSPLSQEAAELLVTADAQPLRGCRKVKETRRKLGWIGMDWDAIRFDGFFLIRWVNRCKQFIGLTTKLPQFHQLGDQQTKEKLGGFFWGGLQSAGFRSPLAAIKHGHGDRVSTCETARGASLLCVHLLQARAGRKYVFPCLPCFLNNNFDLTSTALLGCCFWKEFPVVSCHARGMAGWLLLVPAMSIGSHEKWPEEFRRQQCGSFWGYGCYGIAASCWWFANVFNRFQPVSYFTSLWVVTSPVIPWRPTKIMAHRQ